MIENSFCNTLDNIMLTHKKVLIMMIGVSCSGKSTLAKQISNKYNIPILSTDSLREELGYKKGDNSSTFWTDYENKRNELLNEDKSFILDACNISKQARWHGFNGTISRNYYKLGLIIDPSIEHLKKFAEKREMSWDIITSMLNSFVYPIKDEGFNKIIHIINIIGDDNDGK